MHSEALSKTGGEHKMIHLYEQYTRIAGRTRRSGHPCSRKCTTLDSCAECSPRERSKKRERERGTQHGQEGENHRSPLLLLVRRGERKTNTGACSPAHPLTFLYTRAPAPATPRTQHEQTKQQSGRTSRGGLSVTFAYAGYMNIRTEPPALPSVGRG